MSDLLKFEIDQGVALITLNRPDKLNAFTGEMLESWLEALEECKNSPAVRAVVITGAGRAFTTGGDVAGFNASGEQTHAEIVSRLKNGIQRLPRKLAEIDKPIIAALNGIATGGGLDIALACDIRFASESARFAQTYARMGLIPGAGGAYLLPRVVGTAKALEMFWSCDWVDAKEAERIGLVSKVYPDTDLLEETLSFAKRVAGNAPLAVQIIKTVIRESQNCDMNKSLDIVASHMPTVRTSLDHREAIAAFKDKRPPQFVGQ